MVDGSLEIPLAITELFFASSYVEALQGKTCQDSLLTVSHVENIIHFSAHV